MVEQLICNQQVVGSSPIIGFIFLLCSGSVRNRFSSQKIAYYETKEEIYKQKTPVSDASSKKKFP